MLESLFTNVPLDETIATIFKEVYVEKKIKTLIPKQILEELLLLCTKHLHLRFNTEIYTGIDGVAIGNPLDSLLAIIFMISLGEKVLTKISIYVIGNVMLIILKRMLFLKGLILFQKNQILIILILNSSMN